MIRVIVVENEKYIREATVKLAELESDIEVVATCTAGEEVADLAWDSRPDVVLLDLHLPGMGGLSVAADLRRLLPDVKIVMLTAFPKAAYAHKAYHLGVHGFLPKGTHPDEVFASIRTVYDGGKVYSRELLEQMHDHGPNPLTKSEVRILRSVGWGHSAKFISDRLHLSVGTVRNHITHTFHKLGVTNKIQAVREAEKYGYLDTDDD